MEKEFVSYNQALALKELGFDEVCFKYYENGVLSEYVFNRKINYNEKYLLPAPLYQQAFRFFREKKILGEVLPIDDWNSWAYRVSLQDCWSPFFVIESDNKEFNTYEEAQDACLDKLIELAKESK